MGREGEGGRGREREGEGGRGREREGEGEVLRWDSSHMKCGEGMLGHEPGGNVTLVMDKVSCLSHMVGWFLKSIPQSTM